MNIIDVISAPSELTKKIISFIVGLLILVLVFSGVYWAGGRSVQAKWDAEKELARIDYEQKKGKSDKVTNDTNATTEANVKYIKIKGDTIVKYVDRYITKKDDSDCVIPLGAVRMLNESAANRISDATSSGDDTTRTTPTN